MEKCAGFCAAELGSITGNTCLLWTRDSHIRYNKCSLQDHLYFEVPPFSTIGFVV